MALGRLAWLVSGALPALLAPAPRPASLGAPRLRRPPGALRAAGASTAAGGGAGRPGGEGSLVWVDCEMTGLGAEGGPGGDCLLEVACLITDGELNLIAEGPDLVIHQPDEVLAGMNDWCREHFGWRGPGDCVPGRLADQVRRSAISCPEADGLLLEFVSRHLGKGVGVLAGNTVHMDKRFLDKFCPNFMGHLHYRLVDVSTVKELCRRWHPKDFVKAPAKKGSHRALDDIRESLEELRYYRAAVFKPST